MTTVNKDFMPPRGDYHKLIVYRKAEWPNASTT